jgi:hypothetical protein
VSETVVTDACVHKPIIAADGTVTRGECSSASAQKAN